MKRIITIGREFGSGGREIGRRISEELQIAYYDQEIITEVANRTQLSEDYIQQISERKPFVSYPIHIGHSFYPIIDPTVHNSVQIFAEQHRLLEELSKKSDCIIVGRCADYILRKQSPFRREGNEAAHRRYRPGASQVLQLLQQPEMGRTGQLRPDDQYIGKEYQTGICRAGAVSEGATLLMENGRKQEDWSPPWRISACLRC